jgi:hypothetical protein
MTIMGRATRPVDVRFINPYNIHKPTNPKYYANREELLSAFTQNVVAVSRSGGITRPSNIAVMGRWGIGKTSTLLKFQDILKNECKDARTFSVCITLTPACCVDADTFFVTIMEGVFRQYESTIELPEKVRGFIRDELNVIDRWKIKKISMSPEIERKERPQLRGIHFRETMKKFWEKLHAGGIELAVIMLDDIHYALSPRGDADLLYDLRTEMQALSSADAQYMFIITGPLNLYPEMRDRAEPFTRLFDRFDLGPFDVDGTHQLITKPLQVEGIPLQIDDAVIERIYKVTGGHPFFITLAMRDIMSLVKDSRLDIAGFDRLCPALLEHFARIKFNDDLGRTSDGEKKILRQMALSNEDDISPSSLKGRGTTVLLDRLAKKDLIIKVSRGKYQLYNPLFKEYLKTTDY